MRVGILLRRQARQDCADDIQAPQCFTPQCSGQFKLGFADDAAPAFPCVAAVTRQ